MTAKSDPSNSRKLFPTSMQWGDYLLEVEDEKIVAVHEYPEEKAPSEIGKSILDLQSHSCRITQPMVRKSYLEGGPGTANEARGREEFVAVPWEQAIELAGDALESVREQYGNEAIYAGSYGWASAGRFHDSQAHLQKFLNLIGGFTASDKTYSAAAAEVLLPYILGRDLFTLFMNTTSWNEVAEHGEQVLAFGGISEKNLQVVMSGAGVHTAPNLLRNCRKAGVRFINVSPVRADMADFLEADWIPIRPNTDTALILGMCHTLIAEDLHNREFIDRYSVGFEQFEQYLLGKTDGIERDAVWAEEITGIPADTIRELARSVARQRTFFPMGWALQRAEHGEQPYWAVIALITMIGQVGMAGAGIGHGVGSIHSISAMGKKLIPCKWSGIDRGKNPLKSLIPVARVTEMLERPGDTFKYNGRERTYPDIQLVYWAGGNPFHHHQDLNRLRKAWQKPETVIVNEQVWTATARHADIVFPINASAERNDLRMSSFTHWVSPMPQAMPALGDSRSDFDVFSALAERFGVGAQFTEGRGELEWVRHLYESSRENAKSAGISMPAFDEFWAGEHISIADQIENKEFILEQFASDPENYPLKTPSGKVEIFCQNIADMNHDDCPGHPAWLEKSECLTSPQAERYPLHMVSNQPQTRLHSQLDFGRTSRDAKVAGREPVMINREDAKQRGIKDGDTVRIFNERGACLAGAVVSDKVMPRVVQLSTGAWYDPVQDGDEIGLDRGGNPNVLTRDVGSSSLGQGPTAHSCLVQVEAYTDGGHEVRSYEPPVIVDSVSRESGQ